jgi:hypothetical protein
MLRGEIMLKKDMIDAVLDGHEDDIRNWVARDPGSLRTWLKNVLDLDSKTKDQIQEEFSAYVPEDDT